MTIRRPPHQSPCPTLKATITLFAILAVSLGLVAKVSIGAATQANETVNNHIGIDLNRHLDGIKSRAALTTAVNGLSIEVRNLKEQRKEDLELKRDLREYLKTIGE